MKLILVVLLIAAVLILLLFTLASKVKLVLDTYKSNANMKVFWLHSILKALITMENSTPVVTIYLFNKRLFKRKLKPRNGKVNGLEYFKIARPREIHVDARYGFRDPFTTGVACGALNIASQFINIDSMEHSPDFTAMNDYIYLNADAKVNLGRAFVKFLRLRANS